MSHRLPDGWTTKSLGELFEFKNGFNADRSMYGRGRKFINIVEVINKQSLYEKDIPGQVDISDDSFDLYSVRKGDVLFNRTSETPEEIGLTAVYLDDKPVTFGGFVIRARPIGKELDQNFCKYCFSTSTVRKEIIKRGQGAIRTNIGQGDLSDVCLQIPSKREQEKIAKILSTWDVGIEKLTSLIKCLKGEQLFFLSLLLGQKEKGNTVLGDYFQVKNGFAFKSRDFKKSGTPLIRISNINGGIVSIDGAFLPNEYLEMYKDFQVEKGDILIAMSGATTGKFGIYQYDNPSLLNQRVGKFQAIDRKVVDPRIVRYVLYHLQPKIYDIAAGGAQPNISSSNIESIPLNLPDVKAQRLICDLFDAIERSIAIYNKHLCLLNSQKHGLMQQLLTGKKRVKV